MFHSIYFNFRFKIKWKKIIFFSIKFFTHIFNSMILKLFLTIFYPVVYVFGGISKSISYKFPWWHSAVLSSGKFWNVLIDYIYFYITSRVWRWEGIFTFLLSINPGHFNVLFYIEPVDRFLFIADSSPNCSMAILRASLCSCLCLISHLSFFLPFPDGCFSQRTLNRFSNSSDQSLDGFFL